MLSGPLLHKMVDLTKKNASYVAGMTNRDPLQMKDTYDMGKLKPQLGSITSVAHLHCHFGS